MKKKVLLNAKTLREFSNKTFSYSIEDGIFLIKEKKLDTLSKKILRKYFTSYDQINLFSNNKVNFVGFKEEELLEIIDFQQLSFIYSKENKEFNHNEKFFEKQKKILNENKYFRKYREFELCQKLIGRFPYTYIMFPKEDSKKRFVLYFYILNSSRKEEFLSLLKELSFDNYYYDLIENEKLYSTIAGYALGFSYDEKEKLIRKTLYPGFVNKFNSKDNILAIKKFTGIKIEDKKQIFPNFGIDIYENHNEVKIYEKRHLFKKRLSSQELDKLLHNKYCDKVVKYKDNKEYTCKYEFYIEDFNEEEIKILSKYDLYEKNCKIFSIYLDNGLIIHRVLYYYTS